MSTSSANLLRLFSLLILVGSILGHVAISKAQPANPPTVIVADDDSIQTRPRGEQSLSLAAVSSGPATLDPAFAWDSGATFVVRQVFRGLTRLDDELHPVPELADRIEIAPDGLVYTFHLRKNARFQDGSAITGEDVVYSLTRALNPATARGDASQLPGVTFLSDIEGASEFIAGSTDQLSGVEAPDDRTVEIRLERARSTFLMKLASVPSSIVDADEVQAEENWWQSPNGTGPFVVSEWVDGERLTLTPSDHYYAGIPALQEIEIRLGHSAAQPFNLYQAGEIDVSAVDLGSIDRVLAPESGLSEELTVTPQFALEFVAFRTDVAPMDDPHIRRAVQLGFDRDRIAEVTLEGYVGATCGLIPNGMLGVDWPCKSYPFDPEAAKVEIAKSRYGSAGNVPTIEVYIGVSAAGPTMVDVLRDALEESIGLKVNVIAVELSEYLARLTSHEYPAYSVYWFADYPDPESLLWTLFSSESKDNYTDYHNESFDGVLKRAENEQDLANRIEIFGEAQQLLVDDAVLLPLYYDVSYILVKPYVRGLVVTPIGILGLERLWLEH